MIPATVFVKGSLSARLHEVRARESLRIPVSDGIEIAAELVRPDTAGRFPVLLGFHAYPNDEQFDEIKPVAFCNQYAHIEAGDSNYFARRGYAHVVANVRGTGFSGGLFGNLDRRTILDIAQTIEWLARQSWCDGKVGMLGMSYFSIVQQFTAALAPPSLKAIFAPYGWTDMYRDRYYRGGILVHGFMRLWVPSLHRVRVDSPVRRAIGEAEYRRRVAGALDDPEIAAVPYLVETLEQVDDGANALIADTLIQPLDAPYYRERSIDWSAPPRVPAYLGADWGIYGLHLPGVMRAWKHWAGPKRLTIGPPLYLDRPVYQYQEEALRWFDHWLKGNDTGMMREAPVQIFVDGTGTWKAAHDWPLPETRWTPFFLHQDGLLSEHEFWSEDRASTFVDAPGERGGMSFWTSPIVEATELCGPLALNLWGSSTDSEVLWFASLCLQETDGTMRLLTRGWLRGSQRHTDPVRSEPWLPFHTHEKREPLVPGQIYEFNVEMRPYAILLKPGQRLGIRIRCCDDEKPANLLEAIASGAVSRPVRSTVTVHHSNAFPSHLMVPLVSGNRIGTFMSGGVLLPPDPPPASRH